MPRVEHAPAATARTLLRRDRRPELMDQPGLSAADHAAALRGLERLNRVSRSAGILWPHLRRAAAPGKPLRVLDVATGGGDVPVQLARWAARAGRPMHFGACDVSPTALDYAAHRAARAGVAVDFFAHDILSGPPLGAFDVAVCSLFLHHLDDADAVTLFAHLAAAAPLVLVNDLARGRIGYGLVWAATRALSRSHVVRYDGPLSVRAAFTPAEAAESARRAGLVGVTVTRHRPCRFLLAGRRP